MTVIEIRTDGALVPYVVHITPTQLAHRLEGVPETARWWRRRVLRGDDGYLYTIETDQPSKGWARVSVADSAYQTYRPFALSISPIHEMPAPIHDYTKTIVGTSAAYIDILTDYPKSTLWTPITPVGEHWHPDCRAALMAEVYGREYVRF